MVVLVDHCRDPIFLQGSFLSAIPHFLITERHVYQNSLESTIIHLSEFQSGATCISDEIDKCITLFCKNRSSHSCVNPFACVIPAIPTIENGGGAIISRSTESILINSIEVLTVQARMQFDTFNIFIDAFADDFKDGTVTYMSIHNIADKLTELEHNMDDAKKVYGIISSIKTTLIQNYIDPTKIINQIYGSGFRLDHKNTLLKCDK